MKALLYLSEWGCEVIISLYSSPVRNRCCSGPTGCRPVPLREVAKRLGLTRNAVYIAKSRMLDRVRERLMNGDAGE